MGSRQPSLQAAPLRGRTRTDSTYKRGQTGEQVRPSLQEFLGKSQPNHAVLRKLLLSHEHVPQLAEILERERMSRSALMPTMDNIGADVRKRWLRKT
jgi:hypothetical protein